jgi:hypothetical protein
MTENNDRKELERRLEQARPDGELSNRTRGLAQA